MKKKLIVGLAIGLGMQMMTGIASANTFTGSIWNGTGSSASAALPSLGPPSGSANATFTVTNLDFDTRGTDLTTGTLDDNLTYNSFLRGVDPSLNPNGLVWVNTLGFNINDFITAPASGSDPAEGSFFEFKGNMYFDNNTSLIHDDGFFLTLTGGPSGTLSFDFSTPVEPTLNTLGSLHSFIGGNYNFVLNYGAWNGFPEVLTVSNVPEPATMLLLGTGIAGLAGMRLRRKK
jgi:hypothetical protein